MSPDPGTLYLAAQHREALAGLVYAVREAKGLVVLTGEAGTGKTTLLASMVQRLPTGSVYASFVSNPMLTPREFLEMALLGWGVSNPPPSKALQLFVLQKMLLQARAEEKVVLLVVDEAQALSVDLLEEIRLLGNFEQPERKLLQIVLAGQNEFATVLNRDDLRQFKQRIAVRLQIQPLSAPEAKEYIRFRWMEAGGTEPPFSPEICAVIVQSSKGIPRVINALCDNALIVAYAEASASVTSNHVRQACRDLDLPYRGAVEVVELLQPAPQADTSTPPGPATHSVLPPQGHKASAVATTAGASLSLKTLERYGSSGPAARSFWSRCAGMLGFAH